MSVPGVNFQLAPYKRILAIVPEATELWSLLASHERHPDDVEGAEDAVGRAQPHDVAVMVPHGGYSSDSGSGNDSNEKEGDISRFLVIGCSLHTEAQDHLEKVQLRSKGGALLYMRLHIPASTNVDEIVPPETLQSLRLLRRLASPVHRISAAALSGPLGETRAAGVEENQRVHNAVKATLWLSNYFGCAKPLDESRMEETRASLALHTPRFHFS